MTSAVLRSGGATIVLVQGNEPESQVSKFVDNFGPGVQHIALLVDNLIATAQAAGRAGAAPDTDVLEGDGIRQVFLSRVPATGVRVELIERNGGDFSDESVERLFAQMEEKGIF
jgi:4-hydroxyphenylpyruvate dioxygenase-like putative hemolysin